MSWEFGIYFCHVELDHVADGDVDTNTESFSLQSQANSQETSLHTEEMKARRIKDNKTSDKFYLP